MRRLFLVSVVLGVCLWATPSAAQDTVTAKITASRCTTTEEVCPAPLAVFFSAHAMNSQCSASGKPFACCSGSGQGSCSITTCNTAECDNTEFDNEAFHKLHYKWGFGDPDGGATWATSGQSKNVEYGPIAAHVFNSAGTYTITMTAYSATASAAADSITIYVDDPDTVFAGTDTLCVAAASLPVAGVGGCPTGASVLNDEAGGDNWNEILADAFTAGKHRILFKAGDTFLVDAEAVFTIDGPGTIGSYGSDNDGRAIIDSSAWSGGRTISVSQADDLATDWRFVDLESILPEPPPGDTVAGCFLFADNMDTFERTLFYRLTNEGGNRFIESASSAATYPYGAQGLYIVENTIAAYAYPIYMATRQGGVLGNTIGDPLKQGIEHHWRIGTGCWADMVMAHNHLLKGHSLDATVRSCTSDGTHISQYMNFRANKFDYLDYVTDSFAGVTFWPANNDPETDQRIQDVIIENNMFKDVLKGLLVKTATVRNNLFTPGQRVSGGGPIYVTDVGHSGGLPAGWADDVMIYNNSGYAPFIESSCTDNNVPWDCCTGNGTGSCADVFIEISGDSTKLPDTVARNNVVMSPHTGSVVTSCGSVCSKFTESNNIDTNDWVGGDTPFASATPDPYVISDWYLTGGEAAEAIDTGSNVGSIVYDDFEHTVRPTASGYDIGAVEDPGEAGIVCGDSAVEGSEECDDGGVVPGDGCSATCTVESGWSCNGADPTLCNRAPVLADDTLAEIAENSANETVVDTINPATDADTNNIAYSIVGGNPGTTFKIGSVSGEVAVNNNTLLDYEVYTQFVLQVRATDDGTPVLYDDANITIPVGDVVDASNPVMPDVTLFIADSAPNATVVGFANGTDADGDTLTYTIEAGNELGAFGIDSGTGKITVADTTDLVYSVNPTFSLTVRATDDSVGTLTDDGTITINVIAPPAIEGAPAERGIWSAGEQNRY